jgi:hypothetical protein
MTEQAIMRQPFVIGFISTVIYVYRLMVCQERLKGIGFSSNRNAISGGLFSE